MLTAWQEHPPVPPASCLARLLSPSPAAGTLYLPKMGFSMERWPQGKLWRGCWPQLPGRSSWIIPGVGQSGNVALGAAVARTEHSPTGEPAAGKALGLMAHSPPCSGNSLGTECRPEYSLPQCLLRLRQQMGLLKRCPAPSPLLLPRCAHGSP